MEAINISDLRKEKSFLKLIRKFQKDMNELKKRHHKQRGLVQKQQVTVCLYELLVKRIVFFLFINILTLSNILRIKYLLTSECTEISVIH